MHLITTTSPPTPPPPTHTCFQGHDDHDHSTMLKGPSESGHTSKIPDFPFAALTAGLVWILLVCVDRLIVSHGIHGDHIHSHDHVSQAYLQMQMEKDKEAVPLKEKMLSLRKAEEQDTNAAHYKTLADSQSSSACCEKEQNAISIKLGAPEGGCKEAEKVAHRDSVLLAWVFFFALSLHSVFDGLGVGVATESEFASVTVAVVSHKVFDVS